MSVAHPVEKHEATIFEEILLANYLAEQDYIAAKWAEVQAPGPSPEEPIEDPVVEEPVVEPTEEPVL